MDGTKKVPLFVFIPVVHILSGNKIVYFFFLVCIRGQKENKRSGERTKGVGREQKKWEKSVRFTSLPRCVIFPLLKDTKSA